MKKKGCILSTAIASVVLLGAVLLFMTKGGSAATDHDHTENTAREEAYSVGNLDDADGIVDHADVFESGNYDHAENVVTEEACSAGDLDDNAIISHFDVFESE